MKHQKEILNALEEKKIDDEISECFQDLVTEIEQTKFKMEKAVSKSQNMTTPELICLTKERLK